jgi:hypothetical protein
VDAGRCRGCAAVDDRVFKVAQTPRENLLRLAAQVDALSPSHRDPEAFHLAKSDIAEALRRLAAEAQR